MNLTELLLLGLGLGTDAFAAAVTDGMIQRGAERKTPFLIAGCFGLMQGLMPLLGFYSGAVFSQYFTAFHHLVALLLLAGIGLKQIAEACAVSDAPQTRSLTVSGIILQGGATSLDAFAVGVSFAGFPSFPVWPAVASAGTVTFLMSLCGYRLGRCFGAVLGRKAQICGGLILICIGLHIFISNYHA